MDKRYYDEKGNYIEELSGGWVFINGSCVCEPLSDQDCDKYAVDVMNGNGYYNANGKFIKFNMD